MIKAKGLRLLKNGWDGRTLYGRKAPEYEDATLTFVPYCYWNNRTDGEMAVWVKYLFA